MYEHRYDRMNACQIDRSLDKDSYVKIIGRQKNLYKSLFIFDHFDLTFQKIA